MTLINTIIATLALLGGLLSARAFLPHVHLMGTRASDNLARGLVLSALSTFPRTFYWDVMRSFLGDKWLFVRDAMGGVAANSIFNAILLLGIYYILRARWLTVPSAERHKYNLFTAAFYPNGIWARLSRGGDDL